MEIINLGQIEYKKALNLQLQRVEEVLKNQSDETIFICSHPPVVTLGRKTDPSEITTWKGETVEIKRGGKATYHGPGQTIAYPIINLEKRNKDIHKYLRGLEAAMIQALECFDINAKGDTGQTGVWIQERKIASIGVAVRRWITYHGLAINLFHDPQAFLGINPCGLGADCMTSLEKEKQALAGTNLYTEEERETIRKNFENQLTSSLNHILSPENF